MGSWRLRSVPEILWGFERGWNAFRRLSEGRRDVLRSSRGLRKSFRGVSERLLKSFRGLSEGLLGVSEKFLKPS